jgi:hypothetical protein
VQDRFLVFSAGLLAAAAASGCGGGRPSGQAQAPVQQPPGYVRPWSNDGIELPNWHRDPSLQGRYIGSWGSALPERGLTASQVRDLAADRARQELARMVAVRIAAAVYDYNGTSDAAVINFSSSVSKSMALESIRNSVVRDLWEHPRTGEIYAWVIVDDALQRRMAGDIGRQLQQQSSQDARMAHLNAKLAADEAFKGLDDALDKSFQSSAK